MKIITRREQDDIVKALSDMVISVLENAIVTPAAMQKMVESVIDVAMVACGEKGVIDMTESIEARRDMWLQIIKDRP